MGDQMINAYALRNFVEAQILHDLELAKDAIKEDRTGTWRLVGGDDFGGHQIEEGGRYLFDDWCPEGYLEGSHMVAYDEGVMSFDQAKHIVRWDPDRVIEDCKSRLRLLSMIDRMRSDHCESSLRIMAMPYENVDGFDPEWKLS
jgi:hypothetical protein